MDPPDCQGSVHHYGQCGGPPDIPGTLCTNRQQPQQLLNGSEEGSVIGVIEFVITMMGELSGTNRRCERVLVMVD